MTEIKKFLACDTATTTATLAVTLHFTRRRKLVEVRLEGTMLSEHADALRDFLKNLTYFPGERWTLQLENLEVISLRALRALVKFAHVLRRRGYAVEIMSIRSAVLATLLDLNLHEYFAWTTLERRSNPSTVSPGKVFSLRSRRENLGQSV